MIPLTQTLTHDSFSARGIASLTQKMPLGKGVCVCDSVWATLAMQRGIGWACVREALSEDDLYEMRSLFRLHRLMDGYGRSEDVSQSQRSA